MDDFLKNKINKFSKNNFSDFTMPHISISSNAEAIIDGCFGVIEYCDCLVRINCRHIILKFTGTNLSIKTITDEQYSVKGDIFSLEFSCL